MFKRAFDVGCSAVGLVLLSPLLLLLSVLIKWGSPGPVFYRGRRVGLRGKPFHIFKFRSMVVNAESLGGPSTSDQDARITRVGKFMRKCKLDELPQLINVLLGDMSLVGPRPQVPDYVSRYSEAERDVLRVRPGITDWASIWNSDEGAVLARYPDPDKAYDELIQPTKIKLQLLYAQHHNLWIDLKILAYTAWQIVGGKHVPNELRDYPRPGECSSSCSVSFKSVTELPGAPVNAEQLQMLYSRYGWAGKLADGKDVLEVACGSGIGLGHLASRANRVVGGDYDPLLVELGRRQYGGQIKVQELDAQSLPFEDASFDIVAMFEAIYYLAHPEQFVAEARRVLRPGGLLLICSANCERRDFNVSPFSLKYLTARELYELLERHGFHTTILAGFSTAADRPADRLRELCRAAAVRLRLIPKTMKWKAHIKRLFFGRLSTLPAALGRDLPACTPIVPVDASGSITEYKVIYAKGERVAKETQAAA